MNKTILLLALLLVGTTARAYDPPIEIVEYVDEVRIAATITREDAARNLQWAPFAGPPPLSIDGALRAVEAQARIGHAATDTLLTSVELKQLPHSTDWHYIVRVDYVGDQQSQPHFFVVLMDGHVIPAIRVPESIK